MKEKLYSIMGELGISSGQDKVLHALAGLLVGTIFTCLFGGAIGFLAGFGAGIGKELWDKFFDGTVDYFDMFATALASTFAVMLFGGLFQVEPLFDIEVGSGTFLSIFGVYVALIIYLFSTRKWF